jgi:paraquat-inducible protein B
VVKSADEAARQAEQTLAAFEDVASENGPFGNEVMKMLEELADAARAIRIMAEYLERNPEALIKGKSPR